MKYTRLPVFLFLFIFISISLHTISFGKSNENPCDFDKLADAFYFQSQYDSALYYYDQLSSCDDQNKRYKAYVGMARIYLLQIDIVQAEQFQEKTRLLQEQIASENLHYTYKLNDAILTKLKTGSLEKIFKFINETPETVADMPEAYIWYIESLLADRKYPESRKALEKANQLLRHHPDKAEKFRVSYLIFQADLYMEASQIKQAIDVYELQIFPALIDQKEEWARYQLANTYRLSGMMYQSLRMYEKALKNYFQYLKIVDDLYESLIFRYGEVYFRISNVYKHLGFYSLADEYSIKSAKVYLSLNTESKFLYMKANYNEGLMYKRTGQWEEAIAAFDRVIKMNVERSNSKIYIMESLLHKLDIYNSTASYEAIDENYQALNNYINNFAGKQRERYRFRIDYAYLDVLENRGDNDRLAELYSQLNEQINNKVQIKISLYLSFMNRFSNYLINEQKSDSALVIAEYVLKRFRKKLAAPDQNFINGYLKHLVRTGFLKGHILQNKLDADSDQQALEKVLTCFQNAIDWHMLTKEGYKPLEYDVYSETSITELFESAIGISFKLYQLTNERTYAETAFKFSELSKSNRLLESLNRNLLIQNNGLPDSVIIDLRSIKEQISYLKSGLRRLSLKKQQRQTDSVRSINFQELLLECEEYKRQLMTHLESDYQNYYQVNYGRQFMALTEVQQHLKAKEAMIAYFQGNDNLFSFTVTPDTVVLQQMKPLPAEEVLAFRNNLIPDSTNLQVDDSYALFVKDGNRLYNQLMGHSLKAVNKDKSVNKLYIIPDKSLYFLPFEQLLTDMPAENEGADFAGLPYVIKSYQVSYSNSATILFQRNAKKTNAFSGKLLAFAPTYSELLTDSLQASPPGLLREELSLLKYNQEEVANISKYVSGQVFAGKEATEKQFYKHLENHDILHFAMHGLLDLKESQYSRLVFAEDASDAVNDRFLHNFEIYNLNIPAQLAVLSACNTGVGQLVGGEGAMSLSRAFTYAGVQSVVMTQWPADDKSSGQVMQSFYKHLAAGLPKDQALRLAKLDFLESAHPFKKNPYYWNNFILTGAVKPIEMTNDANYQWWLLLLLLIPAVLIYRRKKSDDI